MKEKNKKIAEFFYGFMPMIDNWEIPEKETITKLTEEINKMNKSDILYKKMEYAYDHFKNNRKIYNKYFMFNSQAIPSKQSEIIVKFLNWLTQKEDRHQNKKLEEKIKNTGETIQYVLYNGTMNMLIPKYKIKTRKISIMNGTGMDGYRYIIETNTPKELLEEIIKKNSKENQPELDMIIKTMTENSYQYKIIDRCGNITPYGTSTKWMKENYPKITEEYIIEYK